VDDNGKFNIPGFDAVSGAHIQEAGCRLKLAVHVLGKIARPGDIHRHLVVSVLRQIVGPFRHRKYRPKALDNGTGLRPRCVDSNRNK